VLSFLDSLRNVTTAAVLVRMVLAMVCGGLIGIEREHKRRPAGFRTHILICLGAAITTLTSQYLALEMHYFTDMARLGAQVIAGIGFIGAGTIIITRRRRVKGLTTAAGLWTAAIVGLAVGAGYYEAAVYTTFLVLLAEIVFSRLEYRVMKNVRDICLFIEYIGNDSLDNTISLLRNINGTITDLEITRPSGSEKEDHFCAVITLQVGGRGQAEKIINDISTLDGIVSVEEL